MGEATAKEESGAAAPEQSDAIVGAAGRLEEACRDLTACLRALPGVAERRAAALLLRAAAVSGRLHLKDAIRLLDAAFEEDQDGPLCGEQRVVPETPERSPPAGPADDQSPRVNGALTSDGEDAGAPNGVADGPAASDDQRRPAATASTSVINSSAPIRVQWRGNGTAKSPAADEHEGILLSDRKAPVTFHPCPWSTARR